MDALIADASIDGGPPFCNLLTNSGCNAGDKCTWIRVSTGPTPPEQLGQVGCAPEGSAPLDGACTYGATGPTTGSDDCMGGLICYASPATEMASGVCRAICSLADATLPCAAGSTCGAYSKFFANNAVDTPLAGMCAPSCNPVTQERDDGAPACGSPDPTMPTLGCYFTSDGWEASCVPFVGTVGHREVVTPPVFISSCLPGAIPMLHESSGGMKVICFALCQPLTVNNTQPMEARDGAEPYSCPEMPHGDGVVGPVARAQGPNERCQHLAFWASQNPQPPNDYGRCVDPTEFTWDHDQMPATPQVPFPMPETLDPYVDAMNPQPNEDLFWGYAPLP